MIQWNIINVKYERIYVNEYNCFGNGVMANILADCVQENDKIVEIIDPLNFEMKKKGDYWHIWLSNHNATKNLIDFAKFNNLPIFIITTRTKRRKSYIW